MNFISKTLLATVFLSAGAFSLNAQDIAEDTLTNAVNKLQSDMLLLKQLKITGYIQGQFQFIDSTGTPTFAGGNFAPTTDKRFMIRRGRLKATYSTYLTTGVLQIDATERGVSLVEVYGTATDPWLRAFSVSVGVMNRPFGYEVPYSSSLRESPERGRMSQIIFSGERDLGAMATFQMPKESAWNWFKIQGGFFNGTGRGAPDFDTQKDFIGQVVITRSNRSETVKYSGGFSYYKGGERDFTKKIWHVTTDSTDTHFFKVDSASTNVGKYEAREYIGVDAQLSILWVGGITTLRGEYIQGTQPGTASSSASFTAAPSATTDIFDRKFNGAYFYFTQNIMQSKHQVVVKYDWYDPNTEVGPDEIKGGSTKTSATDIKYTTLGLGYIFHYDHNVKFMIYYDVVTNESTKLSLYTKDLRDNVVTARMQYRF